MTVAEKRTTIGKIKDLLSLEENWDWNGAKKVDETATMLIADAIVKLKAPLPIPEVKALRDGGVSIEWGSPERRLEIVADPGQDLRCLCRPAMGKSQTFAGESARERCAAWFLTGEEPSTE